MKYLIRWLLILLAVLILVGVSFSIYGNFFLDYSLDNLEKALAAAEQSEEGIAPALQDVYQNLVQGVALDEAVQNTESVKNVVFLNLATRSLGESISRAGGKRAGIYIEQVLNEKKSKRNFLLQFFDQIYYFFRKTYQSLRSLIRFGIKQLSQSKIVPDLGDEYSSILLISQAQEKVKEGNLDQAADLYHNFVQSHPNNPELGFVSIALAQVFVRQKKYEDAKSVLRHIEKEYLGEEEGEVAHNFLNRIATLEDRQKLISRLQALVQKGGTEAELTELKLKLAMAQFSAYQFEPAQKIFEELADNEDPKIQQKAQFYLGWLFKMTEKLEESAEIMLGLIESPDIEEELRLGLHVELADTYYLQNNVEKAMSYYEVVSGDTQQTFRAMEAAQEAWQALANLEQANIYYFDLGEINKGDQILGRVSNQLSRYSTFGALSSNIHVSLDQDLRQKAFGELSKGNVRTAFQLMKEHLRFFPKDPWTHAGIATIYLLFADLAKAQDHALAGYRSHSDEYTTSVLAYVYGYLEDFEAAIGLYEKAIRKDPEYLPAYFNLACMHLEAGDHQVALDILKGMREKIKFEQNYLDARVLNNIGYAYWWMEDYEQARKYFYQAVKKARGFKLAKQNLDNLSTGVEPEMIDFKGESKK